MADAVLKLAYEVSRVTEEKVALIDTIMRRTNLLALNARLEAARAGPSGAAFGVVAQETVSLARDIRTIVAELREAVADNIAKLQTAGTEVQFRLRGERLADLARNAVEIIDRNLYERSCDVRWWATDSAVVNVATTPDAARVACATERLGTILRSYTVYLDLWVADLDGRIIANGRPDLYPHALGTDVSRCDWFRRALATETGDAFVVCDIETSPWLDDAAVATYATAIRADGAHEGRKIGALGIFFDWAPQAAAIVEGAGLSADERAASRVMLLGADNKVLASSDGRGLLHERYDLRHGDAARGFYERDGALIAFGRTPGYETYRGLGWWGCIEHRATDDEG